MIWQKVEWKFFCVIFLNYRVWGLRIILSLQNFMLEMNQWNWNILIRFSQKVIFLKRVSSICCIKEGWLRIKVRVFPKTRSLGAWKNKDKYCRNCLMHNILVHNFPKRSNTLQKPLQQMRQDFQILSDHFCDWIEVKDFFHYITYETAFCVEEM